MPSPSVTIMQNTTIKVRLVNRDLLTLPCEAATTATNAMDAAEVAMIMAEVKPETVKLVSYQVDGKETFSLLPKQVGAVKFDWTMYNGAK